MGKNHKHKKILKSEKAKVKLKGKKVAKVLPKGQNITDTTFKVKKIVIREQLKQNEESEIVSRKHLNVKGLLDRLEHHNPTVRQDAIRDIKDIFIRHPIETLSSNMRELLQGIAKLTGSIENDNRRDSLKVLNLILGRMSNEQLTPFSHILISYLKCGMTDIKAPIREDSLNFLDIVLRNCGSLIAIKSQEILPILLNMIAKSFPLNSKNTSVQWKIKCLERLSSILKSLVSEAKSKISDNYRDEEIIYVDENTIYVGGNHLYSNNLDRCVIDFDKKMSDEDCKIEEFRKNVGTMMPLMTESWLEVRPKDSKDEISVITNEAACILKSITKVIQHIIEYIESIESKDEKYKISIWYRDSFQSNFEKYFLTNFPYSQVKSFERSKKRQNDFGTSEINDKCLEENMGIASIYLWMTSISTEQKINQDIKEKLENILEFINERLDNWSHFNDNSALGQFSKLLRVLFLTSSTILYKNGINLGRTLKKMISAISREPKKELHSYLFAILGDILFDDKLKELHNETSLTKFFKTLPSLLLGKSISYNTINMLNRVIRIRKDLVISELKEKQNEIIDNAKKIEITGSSDERTSRLMICNLFYYVDGYTFY